MKASSSIMDEFFVDCIASNGKDITDLYFHDASQRRFSANIQSDTIVLKDDVGEKITSYDTKKEVLIWVLDSKCAKGSFNKTIGDYCNQCDNNQMVDELWTREMLIAHGKNYSQKLVTLVTTGVPAYVRDFNDMYKKKSA